jgi:hypothetical protein
MKNTSRIMALVAILGICGSFAHAIEPQAPVPTAKSAPADITVAVANNQTMQVEFGAALALPDNVSWKDANGALHDINGLLVTKTDTGTLLKPEAVLTALNANKSNVLKGLKYALAPTEAMTFLQEHHGAAIATKIASIKGEFGNKPIELVTIPVMLIGKTAQVTTTAGPNTANAPQIASLSTTANAGSSSTTQTATAQTRASGSGGG